ncbi:MAG TPA: hypothetical protein VKY36_01950 [Moheibacter sp.]|nr:hypothetical protein [Moheibacter sp.]
MKKKILIRIGSLRHSGAEKVLAIFLKNLPSDKYEIDLLLNLYSGKYLAEIPDWINIYYLNKGEMITTNRPQDIPQNAFRVLYQKTLKKFPKLLYKYILKNKQYDIEFAAIHGLRDDILNSPQKSSIKIVWVHNDLRKTEFRQNPYLEEKVRPWEINSTQLKYLERNIRLLKEKDIPYLLIQTPITQKLYDARTNNAEVDSILNSYGSYKNFQGELKLNDTLDFYDSNHLNQDAVEQFNDLFIDYLKNEKIISLGTPK